MLSIPLFVKTDTRHLVCFPTLLPAAMANSGALPPAPKFPPPGSPLPIIHPNLGAFGSGGSRWEFITVLVPIHWFLTRKMSIVRRMKANYNHGKKSWDTFEFLGRFPIHTHSAPPLIPQTTLDACFQTFFAPVATLYRAGEGELQENFEKHALFYGSLCSDTPPSPVRLLLKGGRGDLYTGYFMREPRKYRKLLILSWILKLWILSRRLLSRIVAISTTIIFLPSMFASLYFYSFPSSTTTRNTTYFCNLPLCISLIINMKKQRKHIKNVLSPRPDNSTC